MKRVFILLFVAALALSIAGCAAPERVAVTP
jgi:hypothetical protein